MITTPARPLSNQIHSSEASCGINTQQVKLRGFVNRTTERCRFTVAMAPAAVVQTPSVGASRPASPPKRGRTEERLDIPSILVGRGQENASTARHNLEQGMDSERKSSENTRIRGRQNSLKRTKNSTDILRQRSLKRDGKAVVADSNHATREGRQFTVANVGNNGKIYLR